MASKPISREATIKKIMKGLDVPREIIEELVDEGFAYVDDWARQIRAYYTALNRTRPRRRSKRS